MQVGWVLSLCPDPPTLHILPCRLSSCQYIPGPCSSTGTSPHHSSCLSPTCPRSDCHRLNSVSPSHYAGHYTTPPHTQSHWSNACAPIHFSCQHTTPLHNTPLCCRNLYHNPAIESKCSPLNKHFSPTFNSLHACSHSSTLQHTP